MIWEMGEHTVVRIYELSVAVRSRTSDEATRENASKRLGRSAMFVACVLGRKHLEDRSPASSSNSKPSTDAKDTVSEMKAVRVRASLVALACSASFTRR